MEREARAAASLAHPNLVTIYDYGKDDDGPFLVMELLDGPTLLDELGEIALPEAVEIGAQLADGLAAIHQAGIVHRDVKPANVIMSTHGPQLTDFGIATDPTLAEQITDPGFVVATPSYAAPEVLRGEEPAAHSDVYSLSMVIGELVSSSESPIGPELQSVLSSAQSGAPDDRPTAAEFAAALRAVKPTLVRPVSAGGSTVILEATTASQGGVEPVAESTARGPRWWIAGLFGLAALGVVALGVALAGNEPNAEASFNPSIASTSTTSTTLRSTSTTENVDATAPSQVGELESLRGELEALLLETPRSDLNPSEVEDLMKKVDESVELAGEGETREAEKKLSKVAKRIDEKLDEESADDSFELLSEIAGLLGLDLDTRDREEDD